MWFEFNQLYVIQSLPTEYDELGDEKKQTGEQLYDDLLKWQSYKYTQLSVYLKKIRNKQEWDNLMNFIYEDCKTNGNKPLLHFEIHGASTNEIFTPGFVLESGELVDIETIGNQLRLINIASGCNLFVTLAVCKGMSLLLNMHIDKPMPFIGAIGSFYEIGESDLYIRYLEFYTELFNDFDVIKAYDFLLKANDSVNPNYRFIPANELFVYNYQKYIKEKCSFKSLESRAKESEKILQHYPRNRAERRCFFRKFKKQEKLNRSKYYKDAISSFFMLEENPENKERFDVPADLNEMKKMKLYLM